MLVANMSPLLLGSLRAMSGRTVGASMNLTYASRMNGLAARLAHTEAHSDTATPDATQGTPLITVLESDTIRCAISGSSRNRFHRIVDL